MLADPILDQIVLSLSETDHITVRQANTGTVVLASAGAGKTTTVGKQLAYGLLSTRPKQGALILTAKSEETANWKSYIHNCRRDEDLRVFNSQSGLVFDPLHYEFTRPGRGAGDIESVIDLFSTLLSIGKKETGVAHDPFWERGSEQIMRNVIKLLELAGERISIANIDRVIKSLPTHPDQTEEECWQSNSYCAALVTSIRARQETLTEDQWSDLEFATEYIFKKWPAFDERPRSSLEMTWSGMADKFLFNPFHRLFCGGKCSFTPEDATRGQIILCDFPLLEFGHETGRLINVLMKLIFQRAWLRRNLDESPNPVFLWQDEFQYFVTRRDNFFQQTCRGSRVSVVCLSQNILNLSEELSEQQPGSKTKSFLGNFGTKVFMQQNCIDTCNYAADQIGKEWRYVDGWNASSGDQRHSHAGISGSRQLVHIVEPIEFSRLRTPDADSPHAQGIVYMSGRTFNATKTETNPKGKNYLSVLFSRE